MKSSCLMLHIERPISLGISTMALPTGVILPVVSALEQISLSPSPNPHSNRHISLPQSEDMITDKDQVGSQVSSNSKLAFLSRVSLHKLSVCVWLLLSQPRGSMA